MTNSFTSVNYDGELKIEFHDERNTVFADSMNIQQLDQFMYVFL